MCVVTPFLLPPLLSLFSIGETDPLSENFERRLKTNSGACNLLSGIVRGCFSLICSQKISFEYNSWCGSDIFRIIKWTIIIRFHAWHSLTVYKIWGLLNFLIIPKRSFESSWFSRKKPWNFKVHINAFYQ